MVDDDAWYEDGLAAVERWLRLGDHEMARIDLAAFDLELSGYVRGEERVVFPAIERMHDGAYAPTVRMRHEHGRLRGMLRSVWDALDRGQAWQALEVLGGLRSVLVLHVAKEDWILRTSAV